MPKNIKEERLRWVLPISSKEIKLVDAVKVCPHSKRSLERWLTAYRKHGEAGLEPKSTRPKTNPNETPIRIKERVIALRKEKKKCALKLSWELERKGIKLHYQTIQKIIKNEGLTRKYRTRKITYKYLRALLQPGELVEMDIKYVPERVKNKRYYQFTAIDTRTRWRYLKVYDDMSTFSAMKFLKELISVAPFQIQSVKTDNGSCFTKRYNGYYKSDLPFPREHAFDKTCKRHNIIHYLIDPGKPQQNGKVERSHREDQDKLYGEMIFKSEGELKLKIKLWNMYYNDLEHCGLNGLTPNEMVAKLI